MAGNKHQEVYPCGSLALLYEELARRELGIHVDFPVGDDLLEVIISRVVGHTSTSDDASTPATNH